MPKLKDLTGQRFGYLTALEKTDRRDSKGSVIWRCLCDCGNEAFCSSSDLLYSSTKSCGCYRKSKILGRITPHRVEGTCIERLGLHKARPDSKSGHVGIHKIGENAYQAYIGFKGERYHLGTFHTLGEAIEARNSGERIHQEFLERYRSRSAEPEPFGLGGKGPGRKVN